jgi:hypothetical protein
MKLQGPEVHPKPAKATIALQGTDNLPLPQLKLDSWPWTLPQAGLTPRNRFHDHSLNNFFPQLKFINRRD